MDEQATLTDGVGVGRPRRPGLSRTRRGAIAAIVVLAVGVGATGCSSDSGDDAATTDVPAGEAGSPSGDGTSTDPADGTDPATDDPIGEGDGDGEITSEQICDAVSVEEIEEATDLAMTGAEPSTSSTPQCAYTYSTGDGPDSNLTLVATRYTSSDAVSISEAFDGAVDVNLSVAGGTDVTQTEVDAGDEAVHIDGEVMDLALIRSGDILIQWILPADGVTPEQVEDLMSIAGDAFA